MNLAELHSKAMNIMAGYFTDHGSLPCVFLALDAKEHMHLLPLPDYPTKREFFEMLLRGYFLKYGVSAYAFASEVWCTESPIDDLVTTGGRMHTKGLPPSQRPDRMELLMTGAADRNNSIHAAFRIVREAKQPPRIGPEYRIGKGEGKPSRDGMFGLLDFIDGLSAESRNAICNVVSYAESASPYFKPRRILAPVEYDSLRN
jgi:hypothetical protein